MVLKLRDIRSRHKFVAIYILYADICLNLCNPKGLSCKYVITVYIM
jgi:hypothetical protein